MQDETTDGGDKAQDAEREERFAGDDPIGIAQRWLGEASAAEINDPTAMALATVDDAGLPNVRMVLLKDIEAASAERPGAFVFYTNFESAKGQELAANPQAALALHWKSLRRQVRARGRVERVDEDSADAYFRSRPYQSRIGAWASAQSRPLKSRAALAATAAAMALRYPSDPPRPAHWGGFRVIPSEIELWSDGAFRLHDRFRYCWTGAGWEKTRLNP